MSKSTGEKAVIALVVGAALGYAAGILTAPKSGKETREDIKVASIKLKKDAQVKLEELKGELGKAIEHANNTAKDLSSKSRQELDVLVGKAKIAQTKAGTVLSAVKSGDADDKDLSKAVNEAKQAKKHLLKYITNS